MHRLKCSEVWGGIKNTDLDACSAGMTVSLYSSSCCGGKGGDVYYMTVCGDDQLTRLVLADVVGHGQQVSEVSQWFYEQMATRMEDPDQPALLADLNKRVFARGFGAMTTAVILSHYVAHGRVFYCYAGHPSGLSRRQENGWNAMMLPSGAGRTNLPLGVDPNTTFDMADLTCTQGDCLFLFSDGLIEAPGTDGSQFGSRRLQDALVEAGDAEPMALKAHILSRLRDWTGGPLDHDDVTLIAIRME